MTFTDPSFTNPNDPGNKPTGLPSDALKAAQAINTTLGRMVNLPPEGQYGVLHAPGRGDEIERTALVSIALSLADIADSLRHANRSTRDGS